jgi:predicted Zn-dependent protease
MSSMIVVQLLVWTAMALELSIGGNGQLSRWLASLSLDVGIMKPSSRQQESEADYIGLMLMAQSCYNPGAAVGLWQRMQEAQKGAPPEWLSTHPSNESRVTHITEWLPKAEEKRDEAGCTVTTGYAKDFRQTIAAVQEGFW